MALHTYSIDQSSEKGNIIIKTPVLSGNLKSVFVNTGTPFELKIMYDGRFNQTILTERIIRDSAFFPKALVRNSKGTFYIPEQVAEYPLFGKLSLEYNGKPNVQIDITIIYE